ncbi:terminase small subunit [Mycobacterium phage MOOREtheMARYer]|uniref:Terminase small subunit n=1 Tax=Mycobacterium phage MOOREtheMARYer TaxID=1647309 RepID=A0A0F6SJV2_9CAUD|nr:terminase small subunit [Mycobacterium phage MOOREtheMARYer]AKF14862.1 hypothetical protein SEA_MOORETHEMARYER_1 [Mycobacterium phage MOOREtheMARYer]
MASKPPLRAVKDGETPPAPRKRRAPAKARTMAHAAKLSRKTMLETMRDKLAAAIDDPRAHPRDIANLMKQLDDVLLKLDALKPQKAAAATPQTAIANTPNASWDQDAI